MAINSIYDRSLGKNVCLTTIVTRYKKYRVSVHSLAIAILLVVTLYILGVYGNLFYGSSILILVLLIGLLLLNRTKFKSSSLESSLVISTHDIPSTQECLYQQMPVGLLLLGSEGEIIYCNHIACKLLQRSENQLVGDKAFSLNWGVIQADFTPLITNKSLLEAGENLILGIRPHSNYNSKLIWLLVNTQVVNTQAKNTSQETQQIICTFSEITEFYQKQVDTVGYAERAINAEEKLRQSAERYRRLSETTFEGIIVHQQGKILDVNDTLTKMTGYQVSELIEINSWDLVSPEYRSFAMNIMTSVWDETYEVEAVRKDGSSFPAEFQGKVLICEEGFVKVTAVRDITQRKLAEAALAKRERYLAALVEVQRCLLADDSDGDSYQNILAPLGQAANASQVYLFENLNFNQECKHEFTQKSTQEHLSIKQIARWRDIETQARIETDKKFQNQDQYQDRLSSWIQRLEKEEIIYGTVDEFPVLEQEYLNFHHILSILILPLTVNNKFWGFIGFDNCQQPRPWNGLEVHFLAAAAAAISLHQERALAEKALSQAKEELEIRVKQRTQALQEANQQLLIEISDRTSAQRALVEAVQIAQSQSLRLQKTLQQLQKAQAQLVQSEKMSSLGNLVAGIAHEINNPITFITGNLIYADEYLKGLLGILHLYQKNYPQPIAEIEKLSREIDLEFIITDLPNLLSSMESGAKRISQIVLSLRNFSRLDEADMKCVNIHDGIDNTLLILQHRLKPNGSHGGISIIKEYSDLPKVECYPGKLNQVFMNILTNAIDILELEVNNSSSTLKIKIRTEAEPNNNIRIYIADNGKGMSPSIKSRIFDPFFTTKPVGSATGLGLSISYQIIVENHKGFLSCTSEIDNGTEFCIQIPISQL
jgi:PAS domain S-box-containing protein